MDKGILNGSAIAAAVSDPHAVTARFIPSGSPPITAVTAGVSNPLGLLANHLHAERVAAKQGFTEHTQSARIMQALGFGQHNPVALKFSENTVERSMRAYAASKLLESAGVGSISSPSIVASRVGASVGHSLAAGKSALLKGESDMKRVNRFLGNADSAQAYSSKGMADRTHVLRLAVLGGLLILGATSVGVNVAHDLSAPSNVAVTDAVLVGLPNIHLHAPSLLTRQAQSTADAQRARELGQLHIVRDAIISRMHGVTPVQLPSAPVRPVAPAPAALPTAVPPATLSVPPATLSVTPASSNAWPASASAPVPGPVPAPGGPTRQQIVGYENSLALGRQFSINPSPQQRQTPRVRDSAPALPPVASPPNNIPNVPQRPASEERQVNMRGPTPQQMYEAGLIGRRQAEQFLGNAYGGLPRNSAPQGNPRQGDVVNNPFSTNQAFTGNSGYAPPSLVQQRVAQMAERLRGIANPAPVTPHPGKQLGR